MTKGPKKILFIDPAPGAESEIIPLLSERGWQVRCSGDRQEAMASLQNWKPDLAVLNILTGAFDPLDLLREVRGNPFTQNQRIVVFSSSPKIEVVTGPSPRVSGYLNKPIDFEALKELLLRAAEKPSPDRPVTVLVADDDEEFSDLVKMFLETNHYRPVVVNDPLKVVGTARAEKPGALLLDLMMPGKDGFRIMEELQDEAVTARIPVVILSALRLDNFQEKGILTGLPEIVSRDMPKELLLKMIEAQLGGPEAGAGEAAAARRSDRPRVLFADDQTELLYLMKEMLEQAGFEVITAENGGEAMTAVFEHNPDIVVLDYNMPVKDGLAVAEALKENPLFAHIPIIICTAFSEKSTKLRGLGMGIDDYLIKPVDADELIARIRMILKRNKQVLDTNPLSKLPGNPSIQARVEREIQKGSDFAVLYIDLDNFKAFNDSYGFEAGDRVIKTTANLLVKLTIQNENSEDFIGHIGGDDFIVVTTFEKAEPLARNVIAAFNEIAPSFYSKEDRERGGIVSTDRQGNIRKFPFLTISIGVVHNRLRPLVSFAQVSNIGTELKKFAKAGAGGNYTIDRRKD
ncbi:MAG TPA: response regulator [Elusimicrobiales bacterium]|nr:response regulator [Elusimicrobiales bacterium]